MKNPFEGAFSRRLKESKERSDERAVIEQEIAELEGRIAMFQHYSEQNEGRLDDGELREATERELAAKREELKDYPL